MSRRHSQCFRKIFRDHKVASAHQLFLRRISCVDGPGRYQKNITWLKIDGKAILEFRQSIRWYPRESHLLILWGRLCNPHCETTFMKDQESRPVVFMR